MDVQFTPSVFPESSKRTDIIRESQVINHLTTVENDANTRRIKQDGKRQVILPPEGYKNVWQGI